MRRTLWPQRDELRLSGRNRDGWSKLLAISGASESGGAATGEGEVVEITVDYEGGLHTRALHGPSRSVVETDAPVDNHGRGEQFSPTDLVAGGLGCCMLTVMGILAERHGWPLAGTRARVEKHMVADPVRRIGRLVVELTFAPGLPDASRKPLVRAAETCPVRESLHPDIEVDLRVRWG